MHRRFLHLCVLPFLLACDPPPAPAPLAAPTGPRPTTPAELARLSEFITVELLKKHVDALASDAMEGRAAGTKGEERAAEYIAGEMRRMALVAAGEYEVTGQTGYLQTFRIAEKTFSRNCRGFLGGFDANLQTQVIVVVAHHDGLGRAGATRGNPVGGAENGDEIWNGADDNASGVAALLAVAEALKTSGLRLKRSVLFLTTGNQEEFIGNPGARFYVDHAVAPRENHLLAVNLDMIGRNPERPFEIEGVQTAKGDALPFAVKRAADAHQLAIRTTDFAGDGLWRSDAGVFVERGIPTLHLWSHWHKDYHRVTDGAEKLSYERMRQVARMIFTLVCDIADAPLPLQFNSQMPLANDQPRLGVKLEDVPGDAKAALNLPAGTGAVRVGLVDPAGIAAKAGFQVGDVIVGFDGKTLSGENPLETLRTAITRAERGRDYVVDLRREGKALAVPVQWPKGP